MRRDTVPRLLLLVPLLGLTLAMAGCETLDALNPFAEREKPLPGARTPVFPEGVPGVDYNQAPPQPANSTYGMAPAEPAPAPAGSPSGAAAPSGQ
ncbi:hypothetical protein MWN33_11880 [Starkeya koreensis]|uniref:Lipoprotein n=1 Tax=Ancylobacter koreensis TaxID=266121 RepID=A0ABT0DNJ1_9HYPH|nr:hypothetical protein [Ancylobacter koreensis]MCK0208727.1 hypothetical protein [Ancylobacter koreensis]